MSGAAGAQMSMETGSVHARLRAWLLAEGVPFEVQRHTPATTAEAAAQARGTPLALGGKSLVLKVGKGATGQFGLFVLRACDALNRARLRRHFGTDRVRFASREELHTLTGLTPGCVPPFGAPIFSLPVYVDTTFALGARVVFTAGRHDVSFSLAVADHLRLARPAAVYAFAEGAQGDRALAGADA